MNRSDLLKFLIPENIVEKVYGHVENAVKRQLFTTVEIRDETGPLFDYLLKWLDNHPYSKESRTLEAQLAWDQHTGKYDALFTPAPGEHVIPYKGHYLFITRKREEGTDNKKGSESLVIKSITADQKLLRQLCLDAADSFRHKEKYVYEVNLPGGSYWDEVNSKPHPRTFDSLILDHEIKQDIINDVNLFISSEEKYRRLDIPYRRGFLFEGPPGNGKSTIVECIATLTERPVFYMCLSQKELDDNDLFKLISRVGHKSIILLEDVDAAFVNRDKTGKDSSQVTMSGLLNALDGQMAPYGAIYIMTTNHKDRLDPALIRPGRADRHWKFDNASSYQSGEMFKRFFPDAASRDVASFTRYGTGKSMAALQTILIEADNDVKKAIKLAKEYVVPIQVEEPHATE